MKRVLENSDLFSSIIKQTKALEGFQHKSMKKQTNKTPQKNQNKTPTPSPKPKTNKTTQTPQQDF